MALSSIELRNAKTAQYLGLKREQASRDDRAVAAYAKQQAELKDALVARLSHILDAATLESMGIAQLESILNEQPAVIAANLVDRLSAMQKWFDARVPVVSVEAEPVQPVVELDQQELAAFRTMCERYYADGDTFDNMSDADPDSDFDSEENYIYRAVGQ